MNAVITQLIPIVAIFLLGYVLKHVGLLNKDNADLFLKVVFYISLPALILVSLLNIQLTSDLIYLPIISVLIVSSILIVTYLISRVLKIEKKTLGVFMVGSQIMNTSFVLPFIIAAYGQEGLARALIFDLGNGLLAYTLAYYIACRYGSNKRNSKSLIKKFLYSIPLIALIVGLMLNLLAVQLPAPSLTFFQTLGNMTIPLLMLSLGIYFSPKIVNFRLLSLTIFTRMILGLLFALLFTKIFGLKGLDMIIVLLIASAPIGYNTLTFSSTEKLDKEFAASVISYSMIVGFIMTSVLIFVLS